MSNYNQLKNASILNPTGNVDLGSPTNTYGNVYMVGNLAIGTTTVSGSTIISPRVNSIVYPGDDTAADPAGGQTITLNGAGFVTGASVLIGSTAASVVSVINSTQISFTSPAMSSGSYVLYIVNPSGATGISIPGLQYSGTPAWSTPAGSLGTGYESAAISNTLTATGDAPIIYSLQSGTLPPGSTLNSGTGLLSGTASSVASSTTYNFTIRATDAQNQDTDRAFSLTVSPDIVTWSAPANNSTTTTYEYTDISNVAMSATSAAGKSITYTANSLPTGITIDGANITGTPTTVGSTSTLLTGTAATTNKTATRTVNFVVNQDVVTWSSPADNTTTSAYIDQLMANVTMSASSAAGKSITYTANALPTGLSISGANITGTPTVVANSSSLVTATASTTNRTATRTFNWVVSVANDIYFKNVSLLLNGETTVTPFISDASTNSFALTIAGDTKPVLFNPYQGDGYYGAYLNGSSYMTFPNNSVFAFGTGAFTIEFWVNFSLQSDKFFLGGRQAIGTMHITTGGVSTSTTPGALRYVGSSTVTSGSTVITDNTWHHCAIVRDGSTNITVYVDGVSRGTGTDTTNYTTTSGTWWFASNDSGGPGNIPTGYISNFRIVKGTAVYTSAFTPSTTPLTAIANTSILLCQSNRFIDKSTNAFSLTVTGLQISPAIPFTASSSYSTYGSTYFDNTGDYLSTPNSSAFAFGTGNFTVEMWVYANSASTIHGLIGASTSGVYWSSLIYTGTLYWQSQNGSVNLLTTSYAGYYDRWTHIAFVRNSGTTTLYLNGVSITSASSDTTNYTLTAGTIDIGRDNDNGPAYMNGYISDVRVVKGTAVYTTAFTPPTAPLTAIANTSLLTLQYNGGANNQGIIDNSNFNNIVTRAGNTSQGTFSPYSVTGWSTYFNGTSDYWTVASNTAFQFGTGDFTIECWVYPIPNGLNYPTFLTSVTGWSAGASGHRFNNIGYSNKFWFGLNGSGGVASGDPFMASTNTFTPNSWYHYALTRSGNTWRMFVNGALENTQTYSGSYDAGYGGLRSGTSPWDGAAGYFTGYTSNLRIIKGTALYTSAFTPSTTPLTPITNTSLLTSQSNRFIDNSLNNFTLTPSGTPSIQALDPFGSVPEATPLSYSNYFDGTGDYLSLSYDSAFNLGTSSFTWEAWIYPTDISGIDGIYGTSGGSGNNPKFVIHLSNGTPSIHYNNLTNGIDLYTTATSAVAVNTWTYLAFVRNSSTWTWYINGVAAGTGSNSTNITFTTQPTYIGYGGEVYFTPLNGYISNMRLVKGTAVYTSAFTPSTTPLTAIANTSLLTCQSTTMIDNSTNRFTLTANGDTKPKQFNPFGYTAQTYTSYTPSLHGGSAYFDGTGDYVQVSTDFTAVNSATSNFTYEAWVYFDSVASGTVMSGGDSSGNIGDVVSIYLSASGTLRVYGPSVLGTVTTTVVAKQWYHIAVTRSTNTFTLWLNGVSQGTFSDSGSVTYSSTKPLTIGRLGQYASFYTTGYISDVRVTKGTAIYTSNFVPPTQTLTNYSTSYPSQLLLNFNNGGIIDYHSSNVLETLGNTQLSTAVKKYNVASMYFDGSGDYINIPYSQLFNFGTGDFTVECWANITYVQYSAIISSTNSTISSSMWLLGFSNTDHIMTFNFDGNGTAICGANYTAYEGVWTHIAVSRSGTTLKLFFNGTQVQSVTNSTSFTGDTANNVTIGRRYNNQTQYYMNGYIDDLRITKGYARYTSNFTPPTGALTTK